MTLERHYANPDETTFNGSLFIFHFGAYGWTEVAVYERPGHIEAALDIAAEWLKENEPGLFIEPDYDAAAREIGVELAQYTNGLEDLDDDTAARVIEVAETDLTYTDSGWLASWEWSVSEEPNEGPKETSDE